MNILVIIYSMQVHGIPCDNVHDIILYPEKKYSRSYLSSMIYERISYFEDQWTGCGFWGGERIFGLHRADELTLNARDQCSGSKE